MSLIEVLSWDSAFFGFPVARIKKAASDWGNIMDELYSKGVSLAYWQSEMGNSEFRRFAQENNAILVDIKTTYTFSLNNVTLQVPGNIKAYEKDKPDEELLNLAVQCGAYSRFQTDQNISREKFEELYRLWMVQSVNKTMADDVLVYYANEQAVGVVTVYVSNGNGNIGLIGVDEQFRGKGIGKALINAAKEYFRERGIERLDVVTQGMNQQACALYERTGFTVCEQTEFYHFWLNKNKKE
jgi:dTDP-4-amino-4,6-dideoxy-D-galactose acyltransferase